jgi:hypothetical protein
MKSAQRNEQSATVQWAIGEQKICKYLVISPRLLMIYRNFIRRCEPRFVKSQNYEVNVYIA